MSNKAILLIFLLFLAFYSIAITHRNNLDIPTYPYMDTPYEPLNVSPIKGVNPILSAADIPYPEIWFVADPFLFIENNHWYLFFEISDGVKGVIGLAESKDGIHWSYDGVILEERFHLAYPYVFKWHGTYYMTPDNDKNQLRLYKAINFPYNWTLVSVLVSLPTIRDPTLFRWRGKWWAFLTTRCDDQLSIYYSDNLTDPSSWLPHEENPVRADAKRSRSAGRPIVRNNYIIRFVQDCDKDYGYMVRAMNITLLNETDFSEYELSQSPILKGTGHGWNSYKMHTINPWWHNGKWFVVADGHNGTAWSIGMYIS